MPKPLARKQNRASMPIVRFSTVSSISIARQPRVPVRRPPWSILGPIRDKYALVVGIGTFKDSSIPQLSYTAKDARRLPKLPGRSGRGALFPKHVELLLDAGATREAILKAIQRIFLQAREQDLLVVYVSSHGMPREGELGLQGVGYIITYDTHREDLFVAALEFQDFSEKVSLIKARRKVIFLDTCFSGEVLRKGSKNLEIAPLGISNETAKLFTSVEGSYLITSSGSTEESWESDRLAEQLLYLLSSGRPQAKGRASHLEGSLRRPFAKGVGSCAGREACTTESPDPSRDRTGRFTDRSAFDPRYVGLISYLALEREDHESFCPIPLYAF